MHLIDKASDLISRALQLVAAVWLFAVSLMILADVVARGLFDRPILGIKELVANSIVIIAFLQLPYTVRIGAMLRAEIIDGWLSPAGLRILLAVAYVLGAVLFFLIVVASWEPMLRAWATGEYEGEGGLRVVTYPVRTVIVAGSVLATVNFILLAIGTLRGAPLPSSAPAH